MRPLVDIGAVGVLWFLEAAASPCSIRWFDKVAPVGTPVWHLSYGAKRTEGPQYIPEQSSPRTSTDRLERPSLRRFCFAGGLLRGAGRRVLDRSEERRVGKECRWWWGGMDDERLCGG